MWLYCKVISFTLVNKNVIGSKWNYPFLTPGFILTIILRIYENVSNFRMTDYLIPAKSWNFKTSATDVTFSKVTIIKSLFTNWGVKSTKSKPNDNLNRSKRLDQFVFPATTGLFPNDFAHQLTIIDSVNWIKLLATLKDLINILHQPSIGFPRRSITADYPEWKSAHTQFEIKVDAGKVETGNFEFPQ